MTPVPSTPAALFGLIMSNLIGEVSMRCAKLRHLWPAGWRGAEIPLPFCTILHRRLNCGITRFRVLFALAEARAAANGGIPVAAVSLSPRHRLTDRPDPHIQSGNPPERLPYHAGWLAQIAQETSALGQQVHDLVTRPDVHPLIASDPRFGRILRPIFHTLGVKPPAYLKLPGRKRIYIPKPRKPREKGWSLDYEKSKDGLTGPPESLPPWYFPKASATAPTPPPVPLPPHPPPVEPPSYQQLLKRFIGHGQR